MMVDYQAVYDKVADLIVDYLRIGAEELKPETNLVDDLCVDSIALVELGFRFSETFSVPMIDAKPELFLMKNLVDFLYSQINM